MEYRMKTARRSEERKPDAAKGKEVSDAEEEEMANSSHPGTGSSRNMRVGRRQKGGLLHHRTFTRVLG